MPSTGHSPACIYWVWHLWATEPTLQVQQQRLGPSSSWTVSIDTPFDHWVLGHQGCCRSLSERILLQNGHWHESFVEGGELKLGFGDLGILSRVSILLKGLVSHFTISPRSGSGTRTLPVWSCEVGNKFETESHKSKGLARCFHLWLTREFISEYSMSWIRTWKAGGEL